MSDMTRIVDILTDVRRRVGDLETLDAGESAANILTKLKTVDGTMSGLDADTVDGYHASAFATAGHNHDDRYYTEAEINALLAGYALLAGRSGGQTLYGGTGAGEGLTLSSTSHATKGDVSINGNLLLPGSGGATFYGSAGNIVFDATGNVLAFTRPSVNYITANVSGGSFGFQTGGAARLFIDSSGNVGVNTTSPAAGYNLDVNGPTRMRSTLYVHDGTGGYMFVSKSAIAGSAITLVPNGSTDCTRRMRFIGVAYLSDGTTFDLNAYNTPGTTYNFTSGSHTLTIRCQADGTIDVYRSAGSSYTFTINGVLIWQ